ncbi:MAG TPA: purine-nucleoside phosphorylase [Kiritimatiellia bacterium]|nr:purine-nucleoside phosphorylase [Kiritimatiellia bacterium]
MDYNLLEQATATVRNAFPNARPSHGLILGSGWSDVAARFKERGSLDYGAIPGLGKTGVVGHAGKLVWGEIAGLETLVFQGRRHYYEGEGWTPCALPVYVMKSLGVHSVLLTNAAGGIRRDLVPGTLMIISDHINNFGANPLIGPHHDFWGPRFPDLSAAYDPAYRRILRQAGDRAKIETSEGVYLASTGPFYETPAEISAYRSIGADAVGMSTVPETILARAAGLRVAGLSCITNAAAGISMNPLTHEEVTETTKITMPKMVALVETFWHMLGELDT